MIRSAFAGNSGFSLAEVALSLAILAAVLGAIVPSLLSVRAADQSRITHQALEGVIRATAAFVQAYGCFPCPSPPSSLGGGFGMVRGENSANACTTCDVTVGFVPFRSLGLAQSAARDGYGHYLTYAVDPALARAGLGDVACKAGDADPPCNTDDIAHSNHKKGLCAANLAVVTNSFLHVWTNGIDQPAAVLVLSHGANGYGAFAEKGAAVGRTSIPGSVPACVPGTRGGENCNADGDNVFMADDAAPFDDQMLYLDRNALVASLGGAACQTAW